MSAKKRATAPTAAPKSPSTHQDSTTSGKLSSPTPVRRNALTSFIRQHCANWTGDTCIGVDGAKQFNQGACLVMQGKPCPYFEKAVLPICDSAYPCADDKAVKQYRLLIKLYHKCNHNIVESEQVKVRLCECGASLLPRQRMCAKCRRRRRLESYRRKNRKSQG